MEEELNTKPVIKTEPTEVKAKPTKVAEPSVEDKIRAWAARCGELAFVDYPALSAKVISYIHALPAYKDQPEKAIWHRLQDLCSDSTRQELLLNMHEQIGIPREKLSQWAAGVFPQALNTQWLQRQVSNRQAGLLIEAFRQRNGLPLPRIAPVVGLGTNVFQEIELGHASISTQTEEALAQRFSNDPLFDQEHFHTICGISNAAIAEQSRQIYTPPPKPSIIRSVFDQEALDSAWLKRQPITKRGGLLVAAWRNVCKLSIKNLATEIGISPKELEEMEAGQDPFPSKVMDSVVTAFKKRGEFDELYCKTICEQSNEAINKAKSPAKNLTDPPPTVPNDYAAMTALILQGFRKSEKKFETVTEAELWQTLKKLADKSGATGLLPTLKLIAPEIAVPKLKAWAKIMFPPALNKDWLDTQFNEELAGLVIQAWRGRSLLSQEKCDHQCGFPAGTTKKLEKAKMVVHSVYEARLIEMFSQDPLFDEKVFRGYCQRSNSILKLWHKNDPDVPSALGEFSPRKGINDATVAEGARMPAHEAPPEIRPDSPHTKRRALA